MKYTTLVLAFAAGAFAVPQAASVTPAPTASAGSGYTAAVSCALSCPLGDVTCQASCLGIARPNTSQAIATNECAAKCDQGNGTQSASEAFAKCVQNCISSLFPSSQTASFAGNAQTSGSNSVSPTGSQSATATGSGGGNAQKTNAADANSARIAGAGLAGFLALFVL